MPYKEKDLNQIYWTIGKIADELNIKTSNIRYWCEEFKITPARKESEERLFNKSERDLIHRIYKLSRLGFTLQGIKDFLEDPKEFIYQLIYIKE